jgi:hypothetical protein
VQVCLGANDADCPICDAVRELIWSGLYPVTVLTSLKRIDRYESFGSDFIHPFMSLPVLLQGENRRVC